MAKQMIRMPRTSVIGRVQASYQPIFIAFSKYFLLIAWNRCRSWRSMVKALTILIPWRVSPRAL